MAAAAAIASAAPLAPRMSLAAFLDATPPTSRTAFASTSGVVTVAAPGPLLRVTLDSPARKKQQRKSTDVPVVAPHSGSASASSALLSLLSAGPGLPSPAASGGGTPTGSAGSLAAAPKARFSFGAQRG